MDNVVLKPAQTDNPHQSKPPYLCPQKRSHSLVVQTDPTSDPRYTHLSLRSDGKLL